MTNITMSMNSSLKYLMLILNTELLRIKLVVVLITDDRDIIVQR